MYIKSKKIKFKHRTKPDAFFIIKIVQKIQIHFINSYKLDVRALGLMRIGVALLLLIDLGIKSLSINLFYTNEGVLPIEILKLYNWNSYYFSFHALSGELWWQICLFIINAVCAILLLIGYRTKIITFVCWVLFTSLQNRNPLICQGGDDFIRLLLFWCLFLPWGERYSIQKTSSIKTRYFSLANCGYVLLVASVYFFSSQLKTSAEWRTDYTAIYYALSLDQLRLPLGTLLYQFPTLMRVLTFCVYYIELLAPLLLIIPLVSSKFRVLGITLIALLFIGIASTLYVGLFYAIGLVALIGLLPSSTINYFETKWYKNKTTYLPLKKNGIVAFEFSAYLKNIFFGIIICFCLMLNLTQVKIFPYALEPHVMKYGSVLRLEQSWGMFSPYVLKDDGYYVFSGTLKNSNKQIDIKHDKDYVSFLKPYPVVAEYESDRWRKYFENFTFNNNNYMRPLLCSALLKKWNKTHPSKQISELTIFFMKEVSLPIYQTKPIEKNALCNCKE